MSMPIASQDRGERTPQLLHELRAIIDQVPDHLIWRAITDPRGNVIAPAWRDAQSDAPHDFPGVDFRGKSVVDLGCNFGHYAFLAARRGARDVLGVEMDENIARACTLLGRLHQVENVRFLCADFMSGEVDGPFDLVFMTDIIGQHKVRRGRVGALVDAMVALGGRELVTSVRAEYDIPGDLNAKTASVAALYPDHVRGDTLMLLEYVQDRVGPGWRMDVIEPEDKARQVKTTVRFTRD